MMQPDQSPNVAFRYGERLESLSGSCHSGSPWDHIPIMFVVVTAVRSGNILFTWMVGAAITPCCGVDG